MKEDGTSLYKTFREYNLVFKFSILLEFQPPFSSGLNIVAMRILAAIVSSSYMGELLCMPTHN